MSFVLCLPCTIVPHLATVLMTIIKQIPANSYPLSLLMWIFPSNRYLPNLPALLQELYYISIFKMAFPKLTEVVQFHGTYGWVNKLYADFVLPWQPVFCPEYKDHAFIYYFFYFSVRIIKIKF